MFVHDVILVKVSRQAASGLQPILGGPRVVVKLNKAQGPARPKAARQPIGTPLIVMASGWPTVPVRLYDPPLPCPPQAMVHFGARRKERTARVWLAALFLNV
jgi:hypothetical protein